MISLYCPAFSGIAIRNELNEKSQKLMTRLRCKSWACPFCAKGNRARWQAFLLEVLPLVSEVWSFHTITLPDRFHDEKRTIDENFERSLAHIRKNFDKLMKRLKRQLGAFQYFRCFEIHKTGAVHIHILISHWIPENELHVVHGSYNPKTDKWGNHYQYWDYLKDNLSSCGFGYITSSYNLKEAKTAVFYTTKYMTKEDASFQRIFSENKVRRFQSSQGIGSQEQWGKDTSAWELRFALQKMDVLEFEHVDLNTKKRVKFEDFDEYGYYPHASDSIKALDERIKRKSLTKDE